MIRNIILALLVLLGCFVSLHGQKNKHPRRLKYFSVGANASMQMPVFSNKKEDGAWNNSKGYGKSLFDYGGGLNLGLSNSKGWGVGIAVDYRTYSVETDKFDYRDSIIPFFASPSFFYFETTPLGISYKYELYEYVSYSLTANYTMKVSPRLSFVSQVGSAIRTVKRLERVFEYYPSNLKLHEQKSVLQSVPVFLIANAGASYSISKQYGLGVMLSYMHSFGDYDARNRHNSSVFGVNVFVSYLINKKK